MLKKYLRPRTKRAGQELETILTRVIQRDGARIFGEILKSRTRRAQDKVSEIRGLGMGALGRFGGVVEKVRSEGLRSVSRQALLASYETGKRQLVSVVHIRTTMQSALDRTKDSLRKLSSPMERAEYLLLLSLYSASYLGGIYLGLSVPSFDLRLFRKGTRGDRIIFHSAPLFTVEVTVAWLKSILEIAANTPDLSEIDRRSLHSAQHLLDRLQDGISRGTSAQRLLPLIGASHARELEVSIEDSAFHALEQALSSLADLTTK